MCYVYSWIKWFMFSVDDWWYVIVIDEILVFLISSQLVCIVCLCVCAVSRVYFRGFIFSFYFSCLLFNHFVRSSVQFNSYLDLIIINDHIVASCCGSVLNRLLWASCNSCKNGLSDTWILIWLFRVLDCLNCFLHTWIKREQQR